MRFDTEVNFLANRDGFKCQRCDKNFGSLVGYNQYGTRRDYDITVDHVISTSLKWPFVELRKYIESIDNKQLLCRKCNVKKYHEEEQSLRIKYNEIYFIFAELRDREDMISRGTMTGSFLNEADKYAKSSMRKSLIKLGITRKDFLDFLKYRAGRLENSQQDIDDLRKFGEYINLEFNEME